MALLAQTWACGTSATIGHARSCEQGRLDACLVALETAEMGSPKDRLAAQGALARAEALIARECERGAEVCARYLEGLRAPAERAALRARMVPVACKAGVESACQELQGEVLAHARNCDAGQLDGCFQVYAAFSEGTSGLPRDPVRAEYARRRFCAPHDPNSMHSPSLCTRKPTPVPEVLVTIAEQVSNPHAPLVAAASNAPPPAQPVAAAAPGVAPPSSTSEQILASLQKFADAMCACADAPCMNKVSEEMVEWSLMYLDPDADAPKATEEEDKLFRELEARLSKCMHNRSKRP